MAKIQIKVLFIGVKDFFINCLACDEQQNVNDRSLIEGQNYPSYGTVGQTLHTLPNNVLYSLLIYIYHYVELTLQRKDGRVVGVNCANRGKCCTHAEQLLYKVKVCHCCWSSCELHRLFQYS